jgi:hypothetical protein
MTRGGGSSSSRGASSRGGRGGRSGRGGRGGHQGVSNRENHAAEEQNNEATAAGGARRRRRRRNRRGRGNRRGGGQAEERRTVAQVADTVAQFENVTVNTPVEVYPSYVEGQKIQLTDVPTEVLMIIVEELKVDEEGEATIQHLLMLSRTSKKFRDLVVRSPGCLFRSVKLSTNGTRDMLEIVKALTKKIGIFEYMA